MKNRSLLALMLCLTLLLAACGGGSAEQPTPTPPAPTAADDSPLVRTDGAPTAAPNTAEDIDVDATVSGGGSDMIIGDMDEAMKQQFIEDAAADGYDVSFGADGSMTMVDPETGETIGQNADGSWVIDDEEGSLGISMDGNWPDNEYTQQLPKPEFNIGSTIDTTNGFVISTAATIEQVKAYAEECKSAGFTLQPETEDVSMAGMEIFMYSADNDAGYFLSITFTSGSTTIMLERP